jgi:phosphonate transport system substrate-binding protein
MRAALLCIVLASLLAGCGDRGPSSEGAGAGTKPTLRFSGIPDQDTTRLKERFEPFARYLADRLGVPVEYVPTADYAASVAAFTNGQIQFAWFGGLSGVQARHNVEGAHAIAQGDADPNFYSYFIAHRDAGLTRSEAFPQAAKGMTFTFGSPQSTSGRLMPEHFIRQNTKQGPEAFFKSVGYAKGHDKTVETVESGAVQVGAVNYKVYDRRVKEGTTDPEVCRVIWKTPVYADYNFTAHPKLEEMYGAGFTAKLKQALLALDDATILAAFQRASFIGAKDADFEGIKKVAEALGFLD